MDALTAGFWITLALVATAVLWRFSSVLVRQIKVGELSAELQLEQARLRMLNAEQARAVGHLGGRPREGARSRRRRKAAGDDTDDEDDEDQDDEEVERLRLVERAAHGIAAGLGIDFEKAMNNDPAELKKVETILGQAKARVTGGNGAHQEEGVLDL